MKRSLLLVAMAFLLGGIVWYLIPERENASGSPREPVVVRIPPAPQLGSVATVAVDESALAKEPSHPMAVSFGSNPALAQKEPALLLEILEFYRKEFGTFPAGQENADIMNALTGNNPQRLPIFPRKHPRIDAQGRLLDAWGKPFVFHPLSSQHLEVMSCGPDGEIFTTDDIRVPPPR
jgi:hypothetical protein